MTDKTDPIAHAARLLREAAQELQQGHTLRTTPNDWTGEPEAKAAYDEHMGAAAALECWAESIGAGGVSGPLMGKPQEMPDLSALTERGAKAWAGVDAQGLRDGVASAGSEPVAHLWQHSETGRTRVVMPDMVVDACATWLLVGPLYLHPSPPEGMVAEQALRKVLSVVQRYLPPDGPTAHDAMTEITEIVDPWPLGPLEKP
ncbi:phage protein [Acidovorax sp. KKS102]|uniref:hypothetical protein n=1 Tax=Acidovorax sp. KKS102 TaxID=358220 RepID=UPI00028B01E4|nr:hypothetical protein [Acidovorax sp. KKS102]AFU45415.1 phage protein [Acidovorax sp. KKS102]